MGTLNELLENFDDDNSMAGPSGAHRVPSNKEDLHMIVQELQQNKIFDNIPGQKHESFKKVKDVLHGKSCEEVSYWTSNCLKEVFLNITISLIEYFNYL